MQVPHYIVHASVILVWVCGVVVSKHCVWELSRLYITHWEGCLASTTETWPSPFRGSFTASHTHSLTHSLTHTHTHTHIHTHTYAHTRTHTHTEGGREHREAGFTVQQCHSKNFLILATKRLDKGLCGTYSRYWLWDKTTRRKWTATRPMRGI